MVENVVKEAGENQGWVGDVIKGAETIWSARALFCMQHTCEETVQLQLKGDFAFSKPVACSQDGSTSRHSLIIFTSNALHF